MTLIHALEDCRCRRSCEGGTSGSLHDAVRVFEVSANPLLGPSDLLA